jgi:hypothetical protein
MRLKKTFNWMHPEFFHPAAWFSWSPPYSYQLPGYYYLGLGSVSESSQQKHRDVFRRKYTGAEDDRFINPIDGRVEKLVVQSKKEIYDHKNDTTWRRTYIGNNSPYIIRLAYWPMSYLTSRDGKLYRKKHEYGDRRDRVISWDSDQMRQAALRWLPACLGMFLLVCLRILVNLWLLMSPDVVPNRYRRPGQEQWVL